MATISQTLGRLFGPSHNAQFASLLGHLAETAVACAGHFGRTEAKDLKGTIDFEHRADAIVDEIHELLDNSFIMRFDIPDTMRLTDDLDNVIDGMRKVAIHMDVYKPLLTRPRPDVAPMFELIDTMVREVEKLVAMLGEPRLDLARTRVLARAIDERESDADTLVSEAERKLVVEFSPAGANRLEFLAWNRLYHMLEQITDDANHCAKLIVSLARKEA